MYNVNIEGLLANLDAVEKQ